MKLIMLYHLLWGIFGSLHVFCRFLSQSATQQLHHKPQEWYICTESTATKIVSYKMTACEGMYSILSDSVLQSWLLSVKFSNNMTYCERWTWSVWYHSLLPLKCVSTCSLDSNVPRCVWLKVCPDYQTHTCFFPFMVDGIAWLSSVSLSWPCTYE